MSERLNLSRNDIINQYPDLADYLSTHNVAQLKDGKRLMSAEEKIEMFGGVEQVGNNIRLAKQKRSEQPYIVLLSCEKEPITGFEIVRFAYLATNREYLFPIASLADTVLSLENEGLLHTVPDITFIQLNGDKGSVSQRLGYLTSGGKAVKRRVELLEQENKGFLGGMVPNPRPI